MANFFSDNKDLQLHLQHPLMRKMVRAGWLGVKTGKGFFEYDGPFGKEIVK